MASKILNTRIQLKYDTEANWASKNPVLLSGEVAISSNKSGLFKVGNGTSNWASLPYNTANFANTSTTATYSNQINGVYTGNGGNQPPSYIPSGKVRFNMMKETGSYCDWILMDTYTGTDVPYVSAIGIEKTSNPSLWIMSGAKSGDAWSIKRKIPAFSSTSITSGQFLSADGTTGQIKTSGYSASSFASASHSHSYLPLSGGTLTGITKVTNTTPSQSTSTGAFVVSGGVGVAGQMSANAVQIGNKVRLEYNSSLESLDFVFI